MRTRSVAPDLTAERGAGGEMKLLRAIQRDRARELVLRGMYDSADEALSDPLSLACALPFREKRLNEAE